MDLERQRQALAIFEEVCDLPMATLATEVARRTRGDLALADLVARLVAGDRDGHELLDAVAPGGAGRDLLVADLAHSMLAGEAATATDAPLPEHIGPYRVLDRLGAGGMGVVYEVEQDRPRRRVAVKTIHPHILSATTIEAFHQEVEVMGTLAHPAIPQVYSAGEHDGVAFMVMELVRGRPIDLHVAGRSTSTRLELLLRVMDGVEHAHDAGIIHADLKPSNILVTLEGEPKILDFGLAISRHSAPPTARGPAGTRGYMAPEQRRGSLPDARSDVFALGVVMGEVLVGPGGGRDVSDLPRDLRWIVARATAAQPEERYPSVAAFADDVRRYLRRRPVAARRATLAYRTTLLVRRHPRGSRVIALVVAALAAATVIVAALDAHERHVTEEHALGRLAAIEARIDGLRAGGDAEGAEAMFAAFVTTPDNLGTRALYLAWTHRAESEAARGSADGVAEAYAQAYNAAREPTDRDAALERLADTFAAAGAWRSADLALDRLADDGPRSAAALLRRRSAAYRRDFAALSAPVDDAAAALRSWAVAEPFCGRIDLAFNTRLEGRAAVYVMNGAEREVRWLSTAPDSRLMASAPLPKNARTGLGCPHPVGDAGRWLLGNDDAGAVVLWEWQPDDADASGVAGTLVARFSAPLGTATAVVGWPGRDGRPIAIVGTSLDTRSLFTIAPAPGGGFTAREAPYDARSPGSDVDVLELADVDGDGDRELIGCFGPWRAYDLRVFELSEDGTPTLLARRTLGAMSAATTLNVDGRTLLAVSKVQRYPNPAVLGDATPYGAAPGVRLFELAGGALVERAALVVPVGVGALETTGKLVAGDFDGDGAEDLALGVMTAGGGDMVVFRRRAGLEFDTVVVGGVAPELVVDAGANRTDHLLLRLADRDNAGWVVGRGGARVPLVAPSEEKPTAPRPLPDIEDPALARIWSGARELAALGMLRAAADQLVTGAMMFRVPALRMELLTESAALLESLGQPQAAAHRYEQALSASPPETPMSEVEAEAAAGAARSHLANQELSEAHARFDALRARGPADLARWAVDTLAWLTPLIEATPQPLTEEFRGPLPPFVEVVAPHSLQRPAARAGLVVRATSDQRVLAVVPLRYDGGAITLSVDLLLQHLEIGASLRVGLRRVGSDAQPLQVNVMGFGGGLDIQRFAGCVAPSTMPSPMAQRAWPVASPAERLRLRVDYLPRGSRTTCRVWSAGRSEPDVREVFALGEPIDAGDYELVFTSEGRESDTRWTLLEATIQRLELSGLTARDVPKDALRAAHARFVDGAAREALAAYDGLGGARVWALMAALDVESESAVAERLRAPAAGAPWSSEETAVTRQLLRLRHGRLAPILARAAPEAFGQEFAEVWETSLRYTADPDVARALMDPSLDGVTGESDEVLRLLSARAALILEAGEAERALAVIAPVLRVAPSPERRPVLAEARLIAASACRTTGDLDGARAHLRAWLDLGPGRERGRETLAKRRAYAPLVPLIAPEAR